MTNIQRERVSWSGFIGAPGISTFYFSDAAAAIDDLFAWLAAMKGPLPTNVSMQMPTDGDIIDALSGDITGGWTQAASAAHVGAYSGGYSAASGFQVVWNTAGILDGRRLKGRTYFVPSGNGTFTSDGTLEDTGRATLQTACNAFVTAMAGNLKVWHRPRAFTPAWTDVRGLTHPAKAARAGGFDSVISAFVPDKSVVLTSRRN